MNYAITESTTGKLISKNRRNQNIRQEQLAFNLGISQSLLSDFENDKISPTIKQISGIAKELKIDPSCLIPGTSGIPNLNDKDQSAVNNVTTTLNEVSTIENAIQEALKAKEETIEILKKQVALLEKLLSHDKI